MIIFNEIEKTFTVKNEWVTSEEDYLILINEIEAVAMRFWPQMYDLSLSDPCFKCDCNEYDCKGAMVHRPDGSTDWVEQTLAL